MREESNRLHHALLKADLPFQTDPFVWLGRLFHFLVNVLAPKHAVSETFSYFLDTLAHSKRERVLDYLGLDYYDPFTGHLFRPPSFGDLEFRRESLRGHLMDSLSRKWWDWHVLPEGMHFFCKYYAAEFDRGILIAENGMALRESSTTALPIRDATSLRAASFSRPISRRCAALVRRRCPCWVSSLVDYRQLRMGFFTPRFGLFTYDFTNHAARLAVDHLGDRPSETYARLIAQLGSRLPEEAAALVSSEVALGDAAATVRLSAVSNEVPPC